MSNYSTDKVVFSRFRPHGRISLTTRRDNVLVYHASGPFNSELLEAVEVMEADALREVKATTEQWIEVVIFDGSCLATNSFIQGLEVYIKKIKRSSLAPIASAYIVPDHVEGASFMMSKFEHCYKAAGIEFILFTSEEEGMNWASTYLEEHCHL